MPYDYDTTHKKIVMGAKSLFLKKGYERTSLREICSSAGVTNGAFYRHFDSKESLFCSLVEPCANELLKMYTASGTACFETVSDVLKAIEISNESIIEFINYMYSNFEIFKLILQCSDGTSYNKFVEELVALEVKETWRFLKEAQALGLTITIPSERSMHMLSHCYFASIFECIVHDYTIQEALSEVKTLVHFFNAGWKKILSI